MMRKPGETAFLDIFERRLRLEGILITRTGLHIGAGGSGDLVATDQPVVRDGVGGPMIPGAGLKGVLRSAAEALLRSFPRPRKGDPSPRLWTCNVVGKDPCVSHDRLRELRSELPVRPDADDLRLMTERVWEESCTVCRLFGSAAMASRVRFPDLLLVDDEMPVLEIRNGVGIDRDKGQAADGVLYDFEAVPPDTRFRLTVVAYNYDDFEIGLLLYLFDELHRGALALGGKTSRGLGQVALEWREMRETSLDGTGGECNNPFADLLREVQRDPLSAEIRTVELALPSTGDQDLWRQVAERIDAMDEVVKEDVAKMAEKELRIFKGDFGKRLGVETGRQTWTAVLRALVDCGRLVKDGGRMIPKAKIEAERAAAMDSARIPPWLLPVYERFVGAMEKIWQEEEAAA